VCDIMEVDTMEFGCIVGHRILLCSFSLPNGSLYLAITKLQVSHITLSDND
jgi:hypothetical protein